MLRSLYSGVSGMRNFQTKMDVIANNISNVNTTAFKSGRVKFQDMLNQTVASAQGPQGNGLGGINPQQIGLGVKVGSIDTIMEGGAMQPTNRGLDFAIEGEGFFTVSAGVGTEDAYTRDGAFYVDNDGNLANASGLKVKGYAPKINNTVTGEINNFLKADENGKFTRNYGEGNTDNNHNKAEEDRYLTIPEYLKADGKISTTGKGDTDYKLQAFNIDPSGNIVGVYSIIDETKSNATTPETMTMLLGQISVTTFSNTGGLTKDGGNNYVTSANSGQPMTGRAGNDDKGYMRQGMLEMSNVDLANEFTEMIVTSRAYQANSRSITTSDEMIQELLNLKR